MPCKTQFIDSCLLVVLYIVADYIYEFNDVINVHGYKSGFRW